MKIERPCPKCNGTGRRPVPEYCRGYNLATYRESDDTLACDNCGGQTMSLKATGLVPVDPATGEGCLHEYKGRTIGNCRTSYTCKKCGDRYDIDSSD